MGAHPILSLAVIVGAGFLFGQNGHAKRAFIASFLVIAATASIYFLGQELNKKMGIEEENVIGIFLLSLAAGLPVYGILASLKETESDSKKDS
jgi:phosphoglycerol transferase MdoB-like AlkP superfamily enzyme